MQQQLSFIVSCALISFKIAAIYICFRSGMIMGWVRIYYANGIDELCEPNLKLSKYIQKPLWDCLTCMSSFWTIVITDHFEINTVLVVCFFCTLINKILPDYE